ncbi:BTB/POZ domain-containing protein 9 [Hypsibius exemplaris]|uniref:BTB/POZ domain-containing protein 9 n=1 Tax=Hypsibius exemplaris TaxID=2072580 RepID=A0A1W0WIN6_HYPEX|nr:BTB/POZ domain-containing protein 9 [Hypsibius exemplaris]
MSSAQGADDKAMIDHTVDLVDDFNAKLLEGGAYSDLTLHVGGEALKLHRVILASRCEYFRALLFGSLRESNESEVTLHETDLTTFKILLKYIYTGKIHVSELKFDVLVGLLGLINQYGFPRLEQDLVLHMKNALNVKNVCSVFEASFSYGLPDLTDACLKYMDRHAKTLLHSREILRLTAAALREVLVRDSLCASEIDVFDVVREWVLHNNDRDAVPLLSGAVRWSLLSHEDLVNRVRSSNLLPSDDILDILATKMREGNALSHLHRGLFEPEVNVATPEMNATVVRGEMSGSLLDGDATNYGQDHGYTRHVIPDKHDADKSACIQVKLGSPCIINHIRMLLWDRDLRSYSYYVELSNDEVHWTKVVDYSHFACRSWQEIYFAQCTVQHIRVVGTRNTANRSFHLVKLEAKFSKNVPEFKSGDKYLGFVVPKENVASLAKFASVVEGVSRSRHALINGSLDYDWDNGYCCHQIGSGAIVVQLNQPYFLSSLRLLLWDVDDRTYTYVIHTSANNRDWRLIVDTRDSQRQSWQTHQFNQQVVSFIKLTGTSNSANEVFHVVHLEAPCQVPLVSGAGSALPVEREADVVPPNDLAAPDVLIDVEFHDDEPPHLAMAIGPNPGAVIVAGLNNNRVIHQGPAMDVDEDRNRQQQRRIRPRLGPPSRAH